VKDIGDIGLLFTAPPESWEANDKALTAIPRKMAVVRIHSKSLLAKMHRKQSLKFGAIQKTTTPTISCRESY